MLADSALTAFFTVVVIDLVLAGDNAIVVGIAAAGLPAPLRRKAILIGIAAAALLRILLAFFAVQLLDVIGLRIAGGLLLLWVVWKLWRETRSLFRHRHDADAAGGPNPAGTLPRAAAGGQTVATGAKTFGAALVQIVVADVSMSLDNVLAVAGTARNHAWVLVIGLALSVALMGLAASLVASLLKRYPWISFVGLALIAWVAVAMIWEGGWDVFHAARHAGVL